MFSEMENSLKQEVAANIFRSSIRPPVETTSGNLIHESVRAFSGGRRERRSAPVPAGREVPPGMPPGEPAPEPALAPSGPYRREGKKTGPNDPCPCGSGSKFKKCCGR